MHLISFLSFHSFKSGSSYYASLSSFASQKTSSAHIFRNVLTAATAHKTKQDATPPRITSCFFFVFRSFKSGSSYHASPSWLAENRLPCLNLFHSMSNLFSCYHVFASRTSGSAHIFRNVLTAATAHKTKQDATPPRITSCFFFVFRSCSCFARPQ